MKNTSFLLILVIICAISVIISTCSTFKGTSVLRENQKVLDSINIANKTEYTLETLVYYEYIIYHHDYSIDGNYELTTDTIPMDTTEYTINY